MIFIKGTFTSMNKYIKAERGNKFGGSTIKKRETEMVRLQVLGKKIKTPAVLKMTWYVKDRRTDPDGICGMAKKFVLDGLVQANVIPDDTFAHIKGFQDEFVISKETGVKIERVEA